MRLLFCLTILARIKVLFVRVEQAAVEDMLKEDH